MTRFTLTRESFIPKGSVKVSDKISDAVAYLSQFTAHAGSERYRAVTMVEVREIGQVSHETGFMTGSCTPVLDKFIGEPIRCRLNESGVKVERHYASLWNGTPARWSSYA